MDHVTVADLRSNVQAHWLDIRVALLAGTYQPQPVRRVEIPKPAGGVRNLGIPTVVARLIQQALLQVLTPILTGEWDGLMRTGKFGSFRHVLASPQAFEKPSRNSSRFPIGLFIPPPGVLCWRRACCEAVPRRRQQDGAADRIGTDPLSGT